MPDHDSSGLDCADAPQNSRTPLRVGTVVLAAVAALAIGFAANVERAPANNLSPPAAPTALAASAGDEIARARALVAALPRNTGTTGTTLPPLPIPDALPPDPYAPTDQVVLASIEIPALGVTGDVQEGVTLTAINRGPGHWPGTALPGQLGNMVIAGHRTTYTKPFANLDKLKAGDRVLFHMPDGSTITYAVRGLIIVPDDHIGIATQSRAHTATLFACHPPHSAVYRIVAKLRLLNPDGTPADPDDALPPIDEGSDPETGKILVMRTPGTSPLTSE